MSAASPPPAQYIWVRTEPVQEIAAEPATLAALMETLRPYAQPEPSFIERLTHPPVLGLPLVNDPALPPGWIYARPTPPYTAPRPPNGAHPLMSDQTPEQRPAGLSALLDFVTEHLSDIPPTEPEKFPTRIGVYCDTCNFTRVHDYLVDDTMAKPDRLEVARAYLRTQGWTCTRAGDYCPNCAPQPDQDRDAVDLPTPSPS